MAQVPRISVLWFNHRAGLCLVTQSRLTLCGPMDGKVACQALLSMGILQARILEWVAILFSRDQTQVSLTAGGFTIWVTKETYYSFVICSLKSGPMMHPTLIPQKGDFVCLFLDSSCTSYYLWFSDNSLLYTLVWIFIHLIGWTIHYDNFSFLILGIFKNYLIILFYFPDVFLFCLYYGLIL